MSSELTPESAYRDLVITLRELGRVLGPAVEARYDSPGSVASDGVPNPTLDVVIDPRRWALSDEVTKATYALRLADLNLTRRLAALDAALSAWEGEETHHQG